MNRRVRVPVRVRPATGSRYRSSAREPAVVEAAPPVSDREVVTPVGAASAPRRPGPDAPATRREPATTASGQEVQETLAQEESVDVWRDRALRLQAEIENFRKRQQRLAEERISADRERLLRAFLGVTDDLERALNTDGADVESLRQGVDLTHQAMMGLLDREGVEPIQAVGQPFDPLWHEAIGTVPSQDGGAAPDTVAQVVQPGYRLGDRLLRPARVIVAA